MIQKEEERQEEEIELLGVEWKKVEYTKNRIKLAGCAIAKDDYSKISQDEARAIVNNWRAAHAFPLKIFYSNCSRKASRYEGAIAVQRLKRFESIEGKLTRQPDMSLTRMQDLGGCRMIMRNISDVYSVAEKFKQSRSKHEIVREVDYIQHPKQSGYRCLHLVHKFFSELKTEYNGMFIEVQIRTELQHMWATAIEMLGLYTRSNLKASCGDNKMLRYMELVSALFALEEQTPLSATVPKTQQEILAAIETLQGVNVLGILRAIGALLHKTDNYPDSLDGYYLLSIDYSKRMMKVRPFAMSEISHAMEVYDALEKANEDGEQDNVLVSAPNIQSLKKAYPNYFADIQGFADKLRSLLQQGTQPKLDKF